MIVRRGTSVIVWCLVSSAVLAQDRPTPDPRKDSLAVQGSNARPSGLPSIDLPEYVITGIASIDLPQYEKTEPVETDVAHWRVTPAPPARDRALEAGPGAPREALRIAGDPGLAGRVSFGIGTHNSPELSAVVRQPLGPAQVSVDGMYGRSTGFAPSTDWSEGALHARVSTPVDLAPIGFTAATLSAKVGTDQRRMHWYGTLHPADDRSVDGAGLGVSIRGTGRGTELEGWSGSVALSTGRTIVEDTSATVVENLASFRAAAAGSIAGIPAEFELDSRGGGRTSGASGSYGVTTLRAGSRWDGVDRLSIQAWIGLAFIRGSDAQHESRLFPGLRAQYALTDGHRLFGAFDPGVIEENLGHLLTTMRYVDANTEVMNTVDRSRGTVGVESDWNGRWRTRFAITTAKIERLPVLVDTSGSGVFRQISVGSTSWTTIEGTLVATFGANTYFSAVLMAHAATISGSSLAVPSVPSVEARISGAFGVSPELSLSGSAQYVHSRETRLSGPSVRLPAYLRLEARGEYRLLSALSVWCSVANITDTVYEHWPRYQEPPFRLALGAAFMW